MRRFLWILLLSGDLLLLALFALGYLAPYVHPRFFWWAELIAVGLPYLTMLLLLATFLVALARRWRLLAVHLVLLGLAAVRFLSFDTRGTAPEGEALTVMTYNVPRWWGYHEEEKTVKMMELIRAHAPDLLVLQEAGIWYPSRMDGVQGAPHLTALVDSLGYNFIKPGIAKDTYTPQPVLSRFRQKEQTETIMRMGPEERDLTRIVRARFSWKGRDAVLYNIHLRTFGREKPWQEEDVDLLRPGFWIPYLRQYREAYLVRAREAEQIRKLLEEETLPYIVCGDFNSTPHNWVYRHLVSGLGLQDAHKVAGSGWGATYHTRLPVVRIDFVLASPEWEVVSAHVADAWLSDHLPLIARLRWRED